VVASSQPSRMIECFAVNARTQPVFFFFFSGADCVALSREPQPPCRPRRPAAAPRCGPSPFPRPLVVGVGPPQTAPLSRPAAARVDDPPAAAAQMADREEWRATPARAGDCDACGQGPR